MIHILNSSYIPVTAEYKKQSIILYITLHKNIYYININNLCNTYKLTVDKWKRQLKTTLTINNLINTSHPFKPFVSDKTNGTWISKSLFVSFGNWLGEKIPNLEKFGT
jgi:hypothetical protein